MSWAATCHSCAWACTRASGAVQPAFQASRCASPLHMCTAQTHSSPGLNPIAQGAGCRPHIKPYMLTSTRNPASCPACQRRSTAQVKREGYQGRRFGGAGGSFCIKLTVQGHCTAGRAGQAWQYSLAALGQLQHVRLQGAELHDAQLPAHSHPRVSLHMRPACREPDQQVPAH